MFTSLVLPLVSVEAVQVEATSYQLVDISVTPSLYSIIAQSIITSLLFQYYRIAGKFGREKVWQIWRIVCDSPN